MRKRSFLGRLITRLAPPASRVIATLAVAASVGASFGAEAAGLAVAPVLTEFAATENAKGIWLSNNGREVVLAQVRVYAWSQAQGVDQLEASSSLAVSPPMLRLEPGQRQLVRIIRTAGAATADAERSFRLLVDELPDPARAQRAGLNFVMQYSIPVFVAPAAPVAGVPQLAWRARQREGKTALTTRNFGSTRAQVSDFELLDRGGKVIASHAGLMGYVLAGASREWQLAVPPDAGTAGASIRARINGESVQQELELEAAAR